MNLACCVIHHKIAGYSGRMPACCLAYPHGVCTASGSREDEFGVTILDKHHITDWTSVTWVALCVLACPMLVAFHVGRRCSGKNREIEVKILKETLETALWCKERSRSNDETVRNKWWSNDETADQLDNPQVTHVKKLSVRRVLPRDAGYPHLGMQAAASLKKPKVSQRGSEDDLHP